MKDLRNRFLRGSVNFKYINLFGTSKWNIYSLCDKLVINSIEKSHKMQLHLNLHPTVTDFCKILQGGFKWTSPILSPTHEPWSTLAFIAIQSIVAGGAVLARLWYTFIQVICAVMTIPSWRAFTPKSVGNKSLIYLVTGKNSLTNGDLPDYEDLSNP